MNRVRFDAEVREAGVAAVAFELDGRRVMTRARPPWSVELDLGAAPRLHRLNAIALDAEGRELARDEALVNAGPHRFAVRLALAPGAAGGVEARAVVDVPEGERVDRLELELNDRLMAVLRQPPWIAVLPAPPAGSPAWVRATAYLPEGGSAEAVKVTGAGSGAAGFAETDVDFVELFATVVDRRGRPVEDLAAGEVSVREDGRPQQIRRFERVADVPVHVGLVLDTSISMAEELDTIEREALRFFRQVLTPRDRAAVIPFADEPRLAARFTGDLEKLAGGLAELEAEGGTALHDALAFALHYFSGLGGKRALVLLSDGEDSGSKIPFEDVLDFARRSGVAIYSIGLGVSERTPQPGSVLDRLARETGGLSFRADRTARLGRIYDEIEAELRQQYLIGYQSDAAGGDAFRRVELEVSRPGVEARAAPGYYP
jgi:VWFA-related protein